MLAMLDVLEPIFTPDLVEKNYPLNHGLVSWWIVMPPTGGGKYLYDVAGLFPGTLTGGPTWKATVRHGGWGAVRFDGTDDYVLVAGSSAGPFNALGTGDFTLACWASKTASTGTFEWFSNNWSSAGHMFGMSDIGKLSILDGSGTQTEGAYTIPTDGTWHHYAITRTGSTLKMYVDGALIGFNSGPQTWTGSMAAAIESRLGARPSDSQWWQGDLDDYRLYNRVLSASDMRALYDESRLGYPNALRRVWVPKTGTSTPPLSGQPVVQRTSTTVNSVTYNFDTPMHNLQGAAAPTANDDRDDNYSPGSIWVDKTADEAYLCTDATKDSAVWKQIT